ncbi:putative reverse transcriptase zinc-binding domain-containing protein [Medicago truncatula]|uniref:Putative reverse transcriptase zinc-binding domain-containing protein n=1 Tax=Medicago truncatula TaxID=3880 RepID=A0A396HZY3_MEDTR|nr:putative reverse transcriptase zinc-binding domain-containing protein [Medicago truncatula]
MKIRDGVNGDTGGWFGERVSKVVGCGNNTLFLCDNWLGGVPLCRRFGRLFELATNKLSTVADMCVHGWEDGGEAWSWRRRLWVWEEEMLEECRQLLDVVFVRVNVLDRWQWDPDVHDGYTVRGAYQILTTPIQSTFDVTRNLIWHKQVPLKVFIVAWRLLKDRLPTRINLFRQSIVQVAGVMCVAGCGHEESATHLFIHCDVYSSLWQHIRAWSGGSRPVEHH